MATERLFKSLRVLVMFSNAVWLGSVLVLEQHYCVIQYSCIILSHPDKQHKEWNAFSSSTSPPSAALQDPGPTIHSVILKMGATLFPVLPFPQDVSSLRL